MNPRSEQARQLKCQGLTYADIGERMGISRQRAQQLVRPPLDKLAKLKQKNKFRCQDCGEKSNRLHGHHISYKSDDVLLLCTSCHMKAHGNDWYHGNRWRPSDEMCREMGIPLPFNVNTYEEWIRSEHRKQCTTRIS